MESATTRFVVIVGVGWGDAGSVLTDDRRHCRRGSDLYRQSYRRESVFTRSTTS